MVDKMIKKIILTIIFALIIAGIGFFIFNKAKYCSNEKYSTDKVYHGEYIGFNLKNQIKFSDNLEKKGNYALSEISDLECLEYLDLLFDPENTKNITDIYELRELKNLKHLNLGYATLSNYYILTEFRKLEYLDLTLTNISDHDCWQLKEIMENTRVYCPSCHNDEYSTYGGLKIILTQDSEWKLRNAYQQKGELVLDDIADLTCLNSLFLILPPYSPGMEDIKKNIIINDFSPLYDFNLAEFYIEAEHINVPSLVKLKKLEFLRLIVTNLTDEDVYMIKKELPDTELSIEYSVIRKNYEM